MSGFLIPSSVVEEDYVDSVIGNAAKWVYEATKL